MRYKRFIIFISLCMLLGCSGYNKSATKGKEQNALINAEPEMLSLSGFVIDGGKTVLPENAVLTVKLEASAKQNIPARLVTEQSYSVKVDSPWAFKLIYDPEKLEHDVRYTLRAEIKVDGRLRFINKHSISAFSLEEPINIQLSPVAK